MPSNGAPSRPTRFSWRGAAYAAGRAAAARGDECEPAGRSSAERVFWALGWQDETKRMKAQKRCAQLEFTFDPVTPLDVAF